MNISLHCRSNSDPSVPHSFIAQYDELFQRLKPSEAAATTSSSLSKLNGLQALHEYTHKILQLPTIQQALARESCKTSVDDLLEGSLRLLDICAIAKDFLLQSKESINELQTSVRRKRGVGRTLKVECGKYLSSRKKLKKTLHKALENLKGFKKGVILNSLNTQDESFSIISKLKEAEAVTLSQLGTLLSFISFSEEKQKERGLSVLVSKLRQPKRVCCDSYQSNINEFEKVDKALLQSLFHDKPYSVASVESFQNHMENLELCIQDMVAGIEGLERQLIKTRVSFLNIYNHF